MMFIKSSASIVSYKKRGFFSFENILAFVDPKAKRIGAVWKLFKPRGLERITPATMTLT